MKLIATGPILSQKIIMLIKQRDNVAFAVAWASAETEVFKAIKKYQKKIKYAVIGTHFYQTHPDVLENFIGCKKVRFILQPQGVFHPKVYLFWSKVNWDILIGSANLTEGAMKKNSELMLHISSADASPSTQTQVRKQINKYWTQGEVATQESASIYRSLWKAQQSALKRVSGAYSSGPKSKAPVHTKIMSITWSSFFKKVRADLYHGFEERCDLLELVREKFRENGTYSKMDLGVRQTIAGLPNDFNKHWGWFGSMRGNGCFYQAVNKRNPHLSAALDLIPLDGAVNREHYVSYIKEFTKAFSDGKQRVSIASRLLALKRPDYFVCLDAKNNALLCKDFGIKKTDMTYDRYWDDIICRILDSAWWNEPKPTNKNEARVWLGRSAMLDAIFYRA
jgi:HKD family nuclease